MPRLARKARNMAVFRRMNERISEIAISVDEAAVQPQPFICECAHIGCTEVMLIPVSAYAEVRDDPTTFLVLPGHDDDQDDDVLLQLPDYSIVRPKPRR